MTASGVHPAAGHRPYLPALYHQIDGTAYEQANCVLATSTMLMDRASVGYWRVAASTLRKLSGDTQGGVTYDLAAATVKGATQNGIVLAPSYGHTRTEMKSIVAGGHAAGCSIDAGVTVNTPYHTGNYTGGHTLFVHAWRFNSALDRDEYLVGDPGRGTATNDTGYVWWPAWLLYKAAEARGNGEINLLVSRDTEGVTRASVRGGTVRKAASNSSTAVATFATNTPFTVAYTVNGGAWTISTHPGTGWHKVGTGFIEGGRI